LVEKETNKTSHENSVNKLMLKPKPNEVYARYWNQSI